MAMPVNIAFRRRGWLWNNDQQWCTPTNGFGCTTRPPGTVVIKGEEKMAFKRLKTVKRFKRSNAILSSLVERVDKLSVISKFTKDACMFFKDSENGLDRLAFLELLGKG